MKNNKLYFIELLRFFSAFSVLVWHYQHFSFKSYSPVNYNKNELPFNEFLRVFYEIGGSGVLVFWCISGFIFFYKYEEVISKNLINSRKFFLNRFSRLYPLHFITLLIVLILQYLYQGQNGNYFVYENNDLYHFFLQVLFISNWGIENGYSFNGPIWSVSIELVVYLIFYSLIKFFGKSIKINLIIIIACMLCKLLTNTTYILFDCVIFFYSGGLTFVISNYLIKRNLIKYINTKKYIISVLVIPLICWYFKLYEVKYFYFIFFITFPCLLLLTSTIEFNFSDKILKFIRVLGNMTYGSYLLHFPFQLLVSNLSIYLDFDIPIYENWFFIFYISSVFILSYFSYYRFELPIQNIIRRKKF